MVEHDALNTLLIKQNLYIALGTGCWDFDFLSTVEDTVVIG